MHIVNSNQLIILHELTSKVLAGLKFNSEQDHFEMTKPLDLTFELSHYRDLEQINQTLNHVLENLSPVASENITSTHISIGEGTQAGTKKNGH